MTYIHHIAVLMALELFKFTHGSPLTHDELNHLSMKYAGVTAIIGLSLIGIGAIIYYAMKGSWNCPQVIKCENENNDVTMICLKKPYKRINSTQSTCPTLQHLGYYLPCTKTKKADNINDAVSSPKTTKEEVVSLHESETSMTIPYFAPMEMIINPNNLTD